MTPRRLLLTVALSSSLAACAGSSDSTSVGSEAVTEAITLTTFETNPKIVAIEKDAADVDASAASLTLSKRDGEAMCGTYRGDHEREILADPATKIVRRYTNVSTGFEEETTETIHYDAKGRATFAQVHFEGRAGLFLRDTYVFFEDGKELFEAERVANVEAAGAAPSWQAWTAPTYPPSFLDELTDPADTFANGSPVCS